MRLWTIHPQHLDRQGLLAVWREGLLAQAVLKGQTKGYKHHPQLLRFESHPDPQQAIAHYLDAVQKEAQARGYNFDRSKIKPVGTSTQIETTAGQFTYECTHLLNKLKLRSPNAYTADRKLPQFAVHPSFKLVPGEIESWEKIG